MRLASLLNAPGMSSTINQSPLTNNFSYIQAIDLSIPSVGSHLLPHKHLFSCSHVKLNHLLNPIIVYGLPYLRSCTRIPGQVFNTQCEQLLTTILSLMMTRIQLYSRQQSDYVIALIYSHPSQFFYDYRLCFVYVPFLPNFTGFSQSHSYLRHFKCDTSFLCAHRLLQIRHHKPLCLSVFCLVPMVLTQGNCMCFS